MKGEFAGINDFEVVAHLVILPKSEASSPEMARLDVAIITLKFKKPGEAPFSADEKKAAVQEGLTALERTMADLGQSNGVRVEVSYLGEGDGCFWVEFGVALLALNSLTGGLANSLHILGMGVETAGTATQALASFMQRSGAWLQWAACRLTPQSGQDARRPGCYARSEMLDLRTSRCRDCGFREPCVLAARGV